MKTRTFYALSETKGIICKRENISTTKAGSYIICDDNGSGSEFNFIAFFGTEKEVEAYYTENFIPEVIDAKHFLMYAIEKMVIDDGYWDEDEYGNFMNASFESLVASGYCEWHSVATFYPKEFVN